ncbi:hypothetical protein TRFO_40137 [Tritrichomonas foetus]|uniref:Uncharacterized protein n=1 Tax=Tritrichomonas foetus TaxID=1144522 RepID=A0A1J4J8P0_9EUKA|nr:hypothetical protein TRFO_40137 [Tritrichomonas foetus]|eukprot:OHS93596.1 hypothetical protein TRFO_40137 [Tritrichomonas foetus]
MATFGPSYQSRNFCNKNDLSYLEKRPTIDFIKLLSKDLTNISNKILFNSEKIEPSFLHQYFIAISSKSNEIRRIIFNNSKFISLIFNYPRVAPESSDQSREMYCKLLKCILLKGEIDIFHRLPNRILFMRGLIGNIKFDCFYQLLCSLYKERIYFPYFENIKLTNLLINELTDRYDFRDKLLYLLNILAGELTISSAMLHALYAKSFLSQLINITIDNNEDQSTIKNAFILLNTLYSNKIGVSPRVIEQINKSFSKITHSVINNFSNDCYNRNGNQNQNQTENRNKCAYDFNCDCEEEYSDYSECDEQTDSQSSFDAAINFIGSIIKNLFSEKSYNVSDYIEQHPSRSYDTKKHTRSLSHPEQSFLDLENMINSRSCPENFSPYSETANFNLYSYVRSYPSFDISDSPLFSIIEEDETSQNQKIESEKSLEGGKKNIMKICSEEDLNTIYNFMNEFTRQFFYNRNYIFLHQSYYNLLLVISDCTPLLPKILKKCTLVENICESFQNKKERNSETSFDQTIIRISKLIIKESDFSNSGWKELLLDIEKHDQDLETDIFAHDL